MKWDDRQKLIEDIQQYKLNPDLSITKNTYIFAKKQPNIKYDEIVLCPFCLMSYELNKFNIRKGLRVCPNCGSNMKLSTLSEINDLNEFAKFVFGYRLNGFWNKICLDVKPITRDKRFLEWNKRLYDLGLSREFWELYRNLRGDIINET